MCFTVNLTETARYETLQSLERRKKGKWLSSRSLWTPTQVAVRLILPLLIIMKQIQEKKEEIWLSPMTTRQHKNVTQNFVIPSQQRWRGYSNAAVIPSQQRWRGYSNAAVRGWLGERVGAWVRGSVPLYLVDTIATTVFAQSLSNFTCKLWMIRGGTLLIWGHRVKGQGQLWHSVYKTLWARYTLQFLPNHFQTSHVSCGWWKKEPYGFGFTGSKVKVKFGTLCIRPCGHDTHYSFSPITFKLHM